ncbi:MAG: dihydroneopterin aldolase [Bacteroidales bacterium]|nr:dihydroneopterin aldolase [Bacteroidales bacterium]
MKGTIELNGLKFHACHGCFDFEREEGTDYLVDFEAELDISRAAETDRLEDTLDYGRVCDIIAEQMDIPSNLLENVAGRIIAAVRAEYPEVGHIRLKISKMDPPVAGLEAATLTVED